MVTAAGGRFGASGQQPGATRASWQALALRDWDTGATYAPTPQVFATEDDELQHGELAPASAGACLRFLVDPDALEDMWASHAETIAQTVTPAMEQTVEDLRPSRDVGFAIDS